MTATTLFDPHLDPYHGGIGQHNPIQDNKIVTKKCEVAALAGI
jgi:hypothetical protein